MNTKLTPIALALSIAFAGTASAQTAQQKADKAEKAETRAQAELKSPTPFATKFFAERKLNAN